MKKTKTKLKILSIAILTIFSIAYFESNASAAGNATVVWERPTENADDLAGYRVFYTTSAIDCSAWNAATDRTETGLSSTALYAIAHIDIAEANTLRDTIDLNKRGYTFTGTSILTAGQTYNFTVVAYDASGNYSECATDSGSNNFKSKFIYRSGDINNSGGVGIADLSSIATQYGKGVGSLINQPWCRLAGHPEDLNGDCKVGIADLSILASEYGL